MEDGVAAVVVMVLLLVGARLASPPGRGDTGREVGIGGKSKRTIISRMCGTELVATASNVESVGQTAIEAGENAIQPVECGARFWPPRSIIRSVRGASKKASGSA